MTYAMTLQGGQRKLVNVQVDEDVDRETAIKRSQELITESAAFGTEVLWVYVPLHQFD